MTTHDTAYAIVAEWIDRHTIGLPEYPRQTLVELIAAALEREIAARLRAEADLAIVHADHKRVLAQLTAAEQRAATAEADVAALRPEVRAFAGLMEEKLRENDYKSGWKSDTPWALYRRLREEVDELAGVLQPPYTVVGEAADVANFAMMIADVCGWLVLVDHPGASLLALARAAVAYIEAPADDANVADLYDELEATTKAWKREIK